jgi:hypothetical protein
VAMHIVDHIEVIHLNNMARLRSVIKLLNQMVLEIWRHILKHIDVGSIHEAIKCNYCNNDKHNMLY